MGFIQRRTNSGRVLVDVDEFDQARVGFAFWLDHELNHVFLVIETVEQQRRAGIEGLR